jgi:hypothetical protein
LEEPLKREKRVFGRIGSCFLLCPPRFHPREFLIDFTIVINILYVCSNSNLGETQKN